jgi:hypothetical protein
MHAGTCAAGGPAGLRRHVTRGAGGGRETDTRETGGLTAEEVLLMDDDQLKQVTWHVTRHVSWPFPAR